MKLTVAINMFLDDMKAEGRINSPRSERAYWDCLVLHAQDVGNRDPRSVGREDIKRTLRRWPNRNTRRVRHAYLTSFYDWSMEEGYRKDNPARAVRRTKAEEAEVYKLTHSEIQDVRNACVTPLEHQLITFGLFTGLRVQELRGLQGRHLARAGWVHVSRDIGKGGKERWVPVLPELVEIIEDLADLGLDEYVFPSQHFGIYDKDRHHERRINRDKPMGATTMWRYVKAVGQRAGIAADIGPHTLRHAFCDLVTRGTSLDVAQALMGHADIGTTSGYRSAPTMDELAGAIRRLSAPDETPQTQRPVFSEVETVGIEPTILPGSGPSERESGQEDS